MPPDVDTDPGEPSAQEARSNTGHAVRDDVGLGVAHCTAGPGVPGPLRLLVWAKPGDHGAQSKATPVVHDDAGLGTSRTRRTRCYPALRCCWCGRSQLAQSQAGPGVRDDAGPGEPNDQKDPLEGRPCRPRRRWFGRSPMTRGPRCNPALRCRRSGQSPVTRGPSRRLALSSTTTLVWAKPSDQRAQV